MMLELDLLLVAGFALAGLGYLIAVNRKVTRYAGSFVLDVPVDVAWDLIEPRPGPITRAGVSGMVVRDEASNDDVLTLDSGHSLRSRTTRHEPPHRLDTTFHFDPPGPMGANDLVHSRMALSEIPGGTQVNAEFVFERRGLLKGLPVRLLHPLQVRSLANSLKAEVARRRAAGEIAGGGEGLAPARAWYGRIAPTRTQAILGLVTLAWLMVGANIQVALAFWFTILVHEYGHVWSMRRHGLTASTFYFLPLFGGVAIGSGRVPRDSQRAEITLMGPAFGLLPGIVFALVAVLGREGWLPMSNEAQGTATVLALLATFLNGFNLLPVVPLDGGHAVQLVTRPLAGRAWLFVSGLVLLGTFVWVFASLTVGLLVAFAILALLWTFSVREQENSEPLPPAGMVAAGLAYLGLFALHVAVIGVLFVTPSGPLTAWGFLETLVLAFRLALFGP